NSAAGRPGRCQAPTQASRPPPPCTVHRAATSQPRPSQRARSRSGAACSRVSASARARVTAYWAACRRSARLRSVTSRQTSTPPLPTPRPSRRAPPLTLSQWPRGAPAWRTSISTAWTDSPRAVRARGMSAGGKGVHGDEAAVLGAVAALAAELAGCELLLQAVVEARGELGGVDVARVQAQHLVAGVAQPLAGGRVDLEDAALQVVDEDTVVDAL